MPTETCDRCGGPTLTLTTYNGQRLRFDAVAVTSLDAPDTVRWYVSRSRGAVPATIATRPRDVPYLVRHQCRVTRDSAAETALQRFTIATSTGPRVPDVPLRTGFRYAYRWPSSWAHVVELDVGMCGAHVLDLTTDAERRRLEHMPVCPRCLQRYRARGERQA